MVIDGKVTLTGSANWTAAAAHNSENLNLIASPTIAAACAGHWNQRLALSLPYTHREDWCRTPEVADFRPVAEENLVAAKAEKSQSGG